MKSIISQLSELGYDTDDLFMPEEFDKAFYGFAEMDWNHGRPVYNVDKINKEFPDIPEGKLEPIFFSECSISDLDGVMIFEEMGDLDPAVIGLTCDGIHAIYDYDKLIEEYSNFYFRQELESASGLVPAREDGESDDEYRDRIEEDLSSMASDQVSVNTLRDYSHMEISPIVVSNLQYELDFDDNGDE